MKRLLYYFDEDTMRSSLVRELRARGVDVVTAFDAGMVSQDDEAHLARATQLGRTLYTFNARDYQRIHGVWQSDGRSHSGIVIGRQTLSVGEQLRGLLRLSAAMSETAMSGCMEFLGHWIER